MKNSDMSAFVESFGFMVKARQFGSMFAYYAEGKALPGQTVRLIWNGGSHFSVGSPSENITTCYLANDNGNMLQIPQYKIEDGVVSRDGYNAIPTYEEKAKYFVRKTTKKRFFLDNGWQVILYRDNLNYLRPSVMFRTNHGKKMNQWTYIHLRDREVVDKYFGDVYEEKAPPQIFWDLAVEVGTVAY